MKRQRRYDEAANVFDVGSSLSKRSKLTEYNTSLVKDRKFYGDEAIPGDEAQELDLDEQSRFSKQNIQRELEMKYKIKKKLKENPVHYLKREQIEGEEGYLTDEDTKEAETQDDDDEGVKMEPFHLSRELEEGAFDKEGTYIYQKDEEETLDNWLEDVNKKEIRKAKEAQEKRLQQQSKKELEESKKQINQLTKEELYNRLLNYIRPSGAESVAQTLKRLAKSANKEPFEAMVELTHRLTTLGIYDIYECDYNAIEHRSHSSSNSNTMMEQTMWEYKWDEANDIYGPFQTRAMAEWQDQGYFPETLLVRKTEEGQKSNFVKISSLKPFSSFLSK